MYLKNADLKCTELRNIKLEDYDFLNKYFELRRPQTSDSAIFNLFLWMNCYNNQYFITDKGLIWIAVDERGNYYTAPPLCRDEDLKECFDTAKTYFNEVLHTNMRMFHLDSEAINILQLSEDMYEVIEDTDYADYIYDAHKLRTLPGKKFHKKKNHVNAFLKRYEGRFQYKSLIDGPYDDIFSFLKQWRREKEGSTDEESMDYELEGIKYVLEHVNVLDCKVGGVYIDGKLEAFSIGSYGEKEQTAYIHVEKANPKINGLYAYINMKFLEEEFAAAQYVNREDDMGLPGLRQSKQSYNPIYMVRKYDVFQKQ
ncbi:MAG: DUF2156 domain-containing protein [Eubacterium sp.]